MGLAIGRRVGESVLLGSEEAGFVEYEVTAQRHEEDFTITNTETGEAFRVTQFESVEVSPEVFIAAGTKIDAYPGVSKLVISAPRRIQIVRRELVE